MRFDTLRTPPHSIEAEQSVLGGLLLDPAAWDHVADVLRGDDFYRPDHRLVFEAIAHLAAQGKPCDAIVVGEYLTRTGKIDEAGGLAYLGNLARETPTAEHVRAYAEIVREQSLRRKLQRAGHEIAASVHAD
ncbi:MAG: replicative DNA helicase, partial [Steroidobacteraceae bacterium]|nr:replicative DNA helicase [Steroidobacteraceae bacterium]